ncbi:MAG: PQQ-binding-like beta-propeller repeat protein [Planctomycetota bacterium]
MSTTTRLARTLLAPACACVLLSACQNAPEPVDRFRTGVVDIETDPYYQSGLRLVWRSYPEQAQGQTELYTNLVGNDLVFQDTANTVSFIEGPTGRVRWTASLGRPLEKFVGAARHNDAVIIASESELQFLDAQNGQLIDRQRLSVLANTRPVLVFPNLIVGSTTGEVFAHDIRVGVRRWGVKLDGPVNAPVVTLSGRDIGAVSEGGELIMLDANTGASGGRIAKLFDGVENRPVTDDAQVYIAGTDQSVWAYDIGSGERVWRHRTQSPMDAQPVLGGGVLVVHAEREGLLGINAQTGQRLWAQRDARGDGVVASDTAATLWDGTTLTVVSLRDGAIRSQHELPGIRSVQAGDNGVIYAIADDGVVSKYEPL